MFYLKRNVPGWERLARLILGLAFAAAGFYLIPTGMLQLAGYITAATLAATGLVGFCPACALVGRKLDRAQ